MTGWLKRAIVVGASAGGIVFLGAATAVATEPDGGDIASDDTTVIEVADGSPVVQVGVCGNAVGIAGDAWASCSGDQDAETSGPETTVGDEDQGGQKPHDDGGDIASDDTTVIEVADGSPVVQVGVGGDAGGIAGDAWASCSGDQDAETSGPETTVGDEDQGGQKPHDVGGDIRAVDDGKGGAADDFAA